MTDLAAIAEKLIAAHDAASEISPITAAASDFDIAAGYCVLDIIEQRRRAQGWKPVGRKIGFTNRTIWPRYNVGEPLFATIWDKTVRFAPSARATIDLRPFVNPRIEPEIVFKLRSPVPPSDKPLALLSAVEWIAPGFEIVQSPFPNWKFKAPDCAAAYGLHGALIIGPALALSDANRPRFAELLPRFTVTLSRNGSIVERGAGANVLGSPALALGYLARALAAQPQFPPLAAGEIVTTGTITDAWPVQDGECWASDYGELGIATLTVDFAAAV